jgi:hypothetical protein
MNGFEQDQQNNLHVVQVSLSGQQLKLSKYSYRPNITINISFLNHEVFG